jgi:hypothetical protein
MSRGPAAGCPLSYAETWPQTAMRNRAHLDAAGDDIQDSLGQADRVGDFAQYQRLEWRVGRGFQDHRTADQHRRDALAHIGETRDIVGRDRDHDTHRLAG